MHKCVRYLASEIPLNEEVPSVVANEASEIFGLEESQRASTTARGSAKADYKPFNNKPNDACAQASVRFRGRYVDDSRSLVAIGDNAK
jgi:hypothetical protein